MIKRLAKVFRDFGYVWTFKDGTKRVPSENDIQEVVDWAVELLSDKDDLTQLERGRLIFQKNDGYIDVYIHAAEVVIG